MKRYRASRLKQLIFPQELIIDKYHVLARKRHFPAFWSVNEESIPLSKLASIQIHRGLFFSKLIIENAGGPYPIIVDGLWNSVAKEVRDLLELIEREMQMREDVADLVGDDSDGEGGSPPPGGGGGPGPHDERSENPGNRTEDTHAMVAAPVEVKPDPVIFNPETSASQAYAHRRSTITNKPYLPIEETQVQPVRAETERKVGEIPSDWKPNPPWAPVVSNIIVPPKKEEGYPVVDPVEFLNREIDTPQVQIEVDANPEPDIVGQVIAVEARDKEEAQKSSPMESLTNWWNTTKDEITWKPARTTRRRRRKLN